MDNIRYEKNCKVIQEKNGKTIDAEVIFFKYQDKMTIIINKSIKLTMMWNGQVYEGRMAGVDLISDGPAIHKIADNTKGRFHR